MFKKNLTPVVVCDQVLEPGQTPAGGLKTIKKIFPAALYSMVLV